MIAFGVMLSLVASAVFGLAPAWRFSRPSLVGDLRGSGTGPASTSAGLLRRAAITLQVAATLALLTAAALSIQSFARLTTLDMGFEPRHVLTFDVVGLDDSRYPTRTQRDQAVEALLARFELTPRVVAAGAVFQRPFEHGPVGMDARFVLDGQPDTLESRQRNPLLNHESVCRSVGGTLDAGDGDRRSLLRIFCSTMKVFHPPQANPADPATFTGNASVARIERLSEELRVNMYRVIFQPAARTAWHAHTGVQILLVIEGRCRVQKSGERTQEVLAGGAIRIEAGERHWHGASPDAPMTHLALNIDASTDWFEQVTDAEYGGG